jgi:SAM-dependent methyltransferase
MDLKDGRFPFDNNMFDFVIMCETLEHLNFNPIPSIKEIYRVLNSSGAVYIALPNLAGWANRKNLLLGKSIHSPISFYFDQYDLTKNLIVAIHWREFTASEMCELLSRLDFAIVKQYYYSALGTNIENKLSIIGKIFKWIVFPLFPSLRDTIVTISRKNKKPL